MKHKVMLRLDAVIERPDTVRRLGSASAPPRTRKQIIEGFKGLIDERLCSFDLTKREMLVARMVLRGKTHESIAKEARIAVPTVKFHVANIYEKAGCQSKAGFFDRVYRGIL